MADMTKLVTKLANGSAGRHIINQVSRDPQKALAGAGTVLVTAGTVLVEVAVAVAPVAIVSAAGYGIYRLGKWIFE